VLLASHRGSDLLLQEHQTVGLLHNTGKGAAASSRSGIELEIEHKAPAAGTMWLVSISRTKQFHVVLALAGTHSLRINSRLLFNNRAIYIATPTLPFYFCPCHLSVYHEDILAIAIF
jgi:hypothetical protein